MNDTPRLATPDLDALIREAHKLRARAISDALDSGLRHVRALLTRLNRPRPSGLAHH